MWKVNFLNYYLFLFFSKIKIDKILLFGIILNCHVVSYWSEYSTLSKINLFDFIYRFHKKPQWYDLGVGLGYKYPHNLVEEKYWIFKTKYFYEKRNFFKLHHYYIGVIWRHKHLKFSSFFDHAFSTLNTKFDYEKDLENIITFNIKNIDWYYKVLLSWNLRYTILHGGGFNINYNPDKKLNLLGIYVHQTNFDYNLTSFIQIAINDFWWNSLVWVIKFCYGTNPSQFSFFLNLISNSVAISNKVIYRPNWGIVEEINLGMIQQQKKEEKLNKTNLNKTNHTNATNKETMFDFKNWWKHINKNILTTILKKGLQEDFDKIWIKSVLLHKNKIRKLDDLLNIGLLDKSLNYHYYLIIKEHINTL